MPLLEDKFSADRRSCFADRDTFFFQAPFVRHSFPKTNPSFWKFSTPRNQEKPTPSTDPAKDKSEMAIQTLHGLSCRLVSLYKSVCGITICSTVALWTVVLGLLHGNNIPCQFNAAYTWLSATIRFYGQALSKPHKLKKNTMLLWEINCILLQPYLASLRARSGSVESHSVPCSYKNPRRRELLVINKSPSYVCSCSL